MRASGSTGFRAPSLAQEYYSYTSSAYQGPGNSLGLTPGIYNTAIVPANSQIARLLGGQKLKPEQSHNYTIGVVWNPIDPLTLSVDAYQITIGNRIALSGYLGTTSPAVRQYLAANGIANTNYNSIAYFTNAVSTKTQGIDLVASYRFDFGRYGRLKTSLSYNYNRNKVTDVKPNPSALNGLGVSLKRVDRRDVKGLLADTAPRSKLVLNALYDTGHWHIDGTVTRYANYTSFSTTSYIYDQVYPSAWLLDIAVSYSLGYWVFTLGADNAFDHYPHKVNAINGYGSNKGTMAYSNFSPYGFNGGYYYTRIAYRW